MGLPLGRWGSDGRRRGRRHGRRRCPAHGLGDLAVGLAVVGCILALRRALLGRRGGLFLCPSLIGGEDEGGEAQDKRHQQGKGPPALQMGLDGRVAVWLPEGQKPSHTSSRCAVASPPLGLPAGVPRLFSEPRGTHAPTSLNNDYCRTTIITAVQRCRQDLCCQSKAKQNKT